MKRNYRTAIQHFEQAVQLSRRSPSYVGDLAFAYAAAGQGSESRRMLTELIHRSHQQYISPCSLAVAYTGLSRQSEAMNYLDKAANERNDCVFLGAVDPRYDSMRTDPRFRNTLRRVGLPGSS